MPLNCDAYGCHNNNQKEKSLDFPGFQTMTLSCDKNGSMLVRE